MVRASLARCTRLGCPLERLPAPVSFKTVGTVLALACAFVAVFGIIITVGATVGKRQTAATDMAVGNAMAAAPDSVSPAFDPTAPDPRAAMRVRSFACEGALSPGRALICSRMDLATADYNLNLVYAATLERSRDPRAIRRARAQWLAALDRLEADPRRILDHFEAFRRSLTKV